MHMWWELLRSAKGASFFSFPGLLTGSEWHLHLDFDEVEEGEGTSSLSFPAFSAAAKIGKKKKNNWNAVGNRWEGNLSCSPASSYLCQFFFSSAVSFAQQQEEGGSGGRSVAKQTTLLLGSPKKNYFFPFPRIRFPHKVNTKSVAFPTQKF